jgi:hypothetical protein
LVQQVLLTWQLVQQVLLSWQQVLQVLRLLLFYH